LTAELLVCILIEDPVKLLVVKESSTLMKFELLCPIIDYYLLVFSPLKTEEAVFSPIIPEPR
jgi:hypothetical protein